MVSFIHICSSLVYFKCELTNAVWHIGAQDIITEFFSLYAVVYQSWTVTVERIRCFAGQCTTESTWLLGFTAVICRHAIFGLSQSPRSTLLCWNEMFNRWLHICFP